MLTCLLLSCFSFIPAQGTDAIERRFNQLSDIEQQELVADLQSELASSDNSLLRQVGKLLQIDYAKAAWLPVHRLNAYSSKTYAPKLKLKYQEIDVDHPDWIKIGKFALRKGVPNEVAGYRYDYVNKGLFEPVGEHWGSTLSSFSNSTLGSWGNLSARCEGVLDHDPAMAKLADYFSHTFRDLDGRVYKSIRLFDAWNSQTTFSISDVESIAFLRNVVDEHKVKSPIDASLHSGIYSRISKHFVSWREYFQLRHTLAALHFDPNAKIELIYEGLRGTFNKAWCLLGYDPQRMAKYLLKHPTRDEFSAAIAKDLATVIHPQLGVALPLNYADNKLARTNAVTELSLLTNKVLRRFGLLRLRR
ncbi:MAG: hypothetical protein H8E25_04640 [Planctomycetes bacterium]|nr:hypothetical protein [Planctomycetota bacterium]